MRAAFIAIVLLSFVALPSYAAKYGVQIGAFKDFDRAEHTQEALEDAGFNSYFSEAEGYKRVRVGPFTTRVEAERTSQALWSFLIARFGAQQFARPWVVIEDRAIENAPLDRTEVIGSLAEVAGIWPSENQAQESDRVQPNPIIASWPQPKLYASMESAGDSAATIIAEGMSYLGVPYRWGGMSSEGFDCSGFVQYLFARSGLVIPRQAKNQIRVGDEIAVDSLTPGDLVFFRTYSRGASHVGIYIGEGDFIHSSSGEGQVTITPLAKRYYANRYLGARRVLNIDPQMLMEMTKLVNR